MMIETFFLFSLKSVPKTPAVLLPKVIQLSRLNINGKSQDQFFVTNNIIDYDIILLKKH